jgi:WhiB family redox-sensing transcriptional regulator
MTHKWPQDQRECDCGCGHKFWPHGSQRYIPGHLPPNSSKWREQPGPKRNLVLGPRFPESTPPACADKDPELWFSFEDSGLDLKTRREQVSEAIDICNACPVRAACLRWALDMNERHGIWGGVMPEERRNIKRNEMRRARRECEVA